MWLFFFWSVIRGGRDFLLCGNDDMTDCNGWWARRSLDDVRAVSASVPASTGEGKLAMYGETGEGVSESRAGLRAYAAFVTT